MFTTAVKDAALRAVFSGPLRLQITDKEGRTVDLPALPIALGQPESGDEEERYMPNAEEVRFPAWREVPPEELGWRLLDAQGHEKASGLFERNRPFEPGDELIVHAGTLRVGIK